MNSKDPYGYNRALSDGGWSSCFIFVLCMIGDDFWAGRITGREWRKLVGELREAWNERQVRLKSRC